MEMKWTEIDWVTLQNIVGTRFHQVIHLHCRKLYSPYKRCFKVITLEILSVSVWLVTFYFRKAAELGTSQNYADKIQKTEELLKISNQDKYSSGRAELWVFNRNRTWTNVFWLLSRVMHPIFSPIVLFRFTLPITWSCTPIQFSGMQNTHMSSTSQKAWPFEIAVQKVLLLRSSTESPYGRVKWQCILVQAITEALASFNHDSIEMHQWNSDTRHYHLLKREKSQVRVVHRKVWIRVGIQLGISHTW